MLAEWADSVEDSPAAVDSVADSPVEVFRVDLAAGSRLILRSRKVKCPVSPAAEADSEADSA